MTRTFLVAGLVLAGAIAGGAGAEPREPDKSPQALADLIDRALLEQWKANKITPAAPADDATWLRRLSLDLCGTVPGREEVAAFLDDERADKRTRKIDEYLADRASAQNLSYLWGNALLSAAAKEISESTKLRPWLEEQFAANVPFADVVREVVAGSGRNDENGATSFVLAYQNDIESLSAVAARTLLGVQIQCAQCHDHPYDEWKQADFNGFTGFFLGARGQRVSDMPPVFDLADASAEEIRRDQMKGLVAVMRRQRMEGDEPGDGDMERDDGMRRRPRPAEITDAEIESFLAGLPPAQRERFEKARERQKNYGEARFLDGTVWQDNAVLTRRAALAEWIVDPANPWFAPSVVNRMWGHFFGKGLVEPVDDLTGSSDRILPQLLATVSRRFMEDGTDLRALVSALVRTRAYALGSSLERDAEKRAEQERWFAAHPLRPFTAEQVLHSLLRATATEEVDAPRGRDVDFERERMRLLDRFRYVFADDEGGDADRFASSIPQALFLMNGGRTNEAISLRKSRMLDAILDETRSDRERLRQIFYATLNRPPTQREAEKLGRLVRGSSGGSKRGIEDLYWALLNCTEFLTNH